MSKKTVLKPKWMRLQELIDEESFRLESEVMPLVAEKIENRDWEGAILELDTAMDTCSRIEDAEIELAEING